MLLPRCLWCKKLVVVLAVVSLFLSQVTAVSASTDVVKRSQAAEEYKWDLTKIYPDRAAFERDLTAVKKLIPRFEEYKGQMNSVESILALFQLSENAARTLQKAKLYAHLKLDLNQADPEAQETASLALLLDDEYTQAASFIKSEIMALPAEKLVSIMADPRMSSYRLTLEKLLKQKAHVLSAEEEKILSLSTGLAAAPVDIFNKLLYADYEPPTIKGKQGEDIKLTDAVYQTILRGSDRDLRQRAFEAKMQSLAAINNTLAAIYAAEVKKNVFLARARNFPSALQAELAQDFVPEEIYTSLLTTTNNNLDSLHQYYELRRRVLGLEEYCLFDNSVPLVDGYERRVPYDEAVQIVTTALQPLGDEYVADLKKALAQRWVDVYEDDHKVGGAYAADTYDTHPFVLLNYDHSLSSVSALAHEMGHAMHFKYMNDHQDYVDYGCTELTAEVASFVNELLVLDYLIDHARSEPEKAYLLNRKLELITAAFFTQVMFSEFESRAHELAEAGTPLTAQTLNNLYLEVLEKHFGAKRKGDAVAKVRWSEIPHFYDSFYVHNYALSFAAAHALVNDITAGKKGAVDDYLTFLAAGNSDYPIRLLEKAGVKMDSPEPVEGLLKHYGELVRELEAVLDK